MAAPRRIGTANLTAGYEGFERNIATGVPGMAHFAGTGPAGATCRSCKNWGSYQPFKREAGELRPRRCVKYPRLAYGDVVNAGIPHATPACSYFQESENVPPVDPGRRRKRKF